MSDIISSPLALLTLTVGIYYGAMQLYKQTKLVIFNPLLMTMLIIIAILKLLDIPYSIYYKANEMINFMLGLSVVALGYLLHENMKHIQGKQWSILCSVFVGSIVGVVSVVAMAHIMGVGAEISASLQPKSVTTPIAIALSTNSGGIAALTSVAVVVVGLLGSIVGPYMLNKMGIKSPLARGLALGAGSHAVGTAKAMELGAVEGAIAGAAIGVMGVMTAIVIPLIELIMNML